MASKTSQADGARGADIVRVHDPHENVAAVNVVRATEDPATFEEQ